MSTRVIILVSDLDDAAHGEINVLENPEEASRFVESLLESGFDQERIRAFTGEELQMLIRHRPVVNLLQDDERTTKEVAPQEAPAQSQPEEAEEKVATRAASVQLQEEGGEPFVKNGIRFSSLFRPA